MRSIYLILICILFSCADNSTIQQLRGEAFGTYYYIKTVDSDLSNIRPEVEHLIDSINASMSTYQSNSIISTLNKQKKARVDEMFIDVFKSSQNIHRITDGYFDPTVGLLVEYYGFGSKKSDTSIAFDSLVKYVGLDLLKLKDDTIFKQYQQTQLDFNSIAKGYAVDQFASLLNNEGLENYLIDIGGEVIANGKKANNKPWIVGIDQPIKSKSTNQRKLAAKLPLANQAMATSGNYRKYKINAETGKETVHTINPKTGKAMPSSVLSASVIAEDCMTADAYATAFMAMGYKKAIDIIETHPELEAYLIYRSDNVDEQTYVSEGFKAVFVD